MSCALDFFSYVFVEIANCPLKYSVLYKVSSFIQTSATYYDVCSALTLDPCHSVALAMKVELEELAQQCKNQVSTSHLCLP